MPRRPDGRRRAPVPQKPGPSHEPPRQTARSSYPAPDDRHYDAALDLVELVGRRHAAGRPARLGFYDHADVAAILMAALDVAALAVREVDRLRPDGLPFLERLRRVGGAA